MRVENCFLLFYCSDAYDSGAAAVAYWLGSTLKAGWMP